MCGIVGFTGKHQAAPILLDGLSKLEYRGYDSAGLAVRDGEKLAEVVKAKGRLSNLIEKTDSGNALVGTCGIGHTRWATHGEPSVTNAHPHVSGNCTGSGSGEVESEVVGVHNGIIENYQELKDKLLKHGYSFYSQTDTEVVIKLVDYYYKKYKLGPIDAIAKTMVRVRGSYALELMFKDYPGEIWVARKDSPMIIGISDGETYVASDVPAILKYTRKVAYLDDGDMAVFTATSVFFYNAAGDPVRKVPETIAWDLSDAERGGYPHFMLKEIFEQPKALRDTICPRLPGQQVVLDDLNLSDRDWQSLRRVYVVACGSAYYVGCLGKYILEKTCRVPTEPIQASEFRYASPVLDAHTLVIIISQSGETADTLAALREAKRQGARTLAIVNVVGSAIAKAAHQVLYTWAGPEIAVATTKAYSTQLAAFCLVALRMAQALGTMPPAEWAAFREALGKLPDMVEQTLSQAHIAQVQYYASALFDHHDVFFIGRHLDSATCLEGSLKLKEVAYVHAEAYPAGELKHGPISLIEPGTLVVAVATVRELFDKTMANIKEVKARGAEVLCVTTQSMAGEAEKTADHVLTVPDTHPLLQPSLSVLPLQTFAYYTALARGCDVDKPRNLAKSVTVE